MSLPRTWSNLPSVMPAAPASRSTYSRLFEIAAPAGSGSAAAAAPGIARAVRQEAAAAVVLSFILPSGGKRPPPQGTIGQQPTPPAGVQDGSVARASRLRRVHDMP